MKIKPIIFVFFILIAYHSWSQANQFQVLRGSVKDRETLDNLAHASITFYNDKDSFVTQSLTDGSYAIEKIPLGRYNLVVELFGYKPFVANDLIANAGKELVVNAELELEITSRTDVTITKKGNPARTNNEMIMVSGRQFTIDQTNRFAGSLSDPSRMAANFAGVGATGGQRNDIVIRGNSPMGLLWRLDGIDIPNPNHFSSQGTTGGPVNILNNNNLANSDFITGAFPAEYGNATSGVFDLRMRNGNNKKREYLFQIGFNGLELGAEGPFSKNSKASYMANYRYSTLALFDKIGFNTTFNGVPYYQDLSFKINLPETKSGDWALTGIGGISSVELLDSKKDSADLNFGFGARSNLTNGSSMGALILSNTQKYKIGYWKNIVSVSYQKLFTVFDTLAIDDKATTTYAENNVRNRISFHSYFNHRISNKMVMRSGIMANYFSANVKDSAMNEKGVMVNFRNFAGQGFFGQVYSQMKYTLSKKLTTNIGVYSQFWQKNNSVSIEPRLGLKYQINGLQSINFGYGLHSQTQPLEIYFVETYNENTKKYYQTNQNLGFSKSHQLVFGYDILPAKNWRIKSELYYQYLFQVPISEFRRDQYSVLNFGGDFGGLTPVDSLHNKGTGYNYGIELTIEKFFSKNYYLLVTGSVFQSKYKPSDGKTYNTAFNGNYVLNALGGYEFILGKRKQNVLAFNLKGTVAGGRRYTPVDVAASLKERQTEYDWDNAYTMQFKTFFRTDFKISYKWNMKRITQEWALDIQNVFNTQNPLNTVFDLQKGVSRTQYQQGRFPIVQYKLYF